MLKDSLAKNMKMSKFEGHVSTLIYSTLKIGHLHFDVEQQQLAQAKDLKTCKVNGKNSISRDVFVKKWRQLNKNMSLQEEVLCTLRPCEFERIFKVEIPPFMLAEILETMSTCFQVPHTNPKGAPQVFKKPIYFLLFL
jgi:hypothetical protein